MRLAFVTSEIAPFSKTGGLADVAEALPEALAELGIEVTVFSPLYRGAAAMLADLAPDADELPGSTLWIGNEQHHARYQVTHRRGCRLVFVGDDAYYDRPHLYLGPDGNDYADNVARFAFLCRAALEFGLWHGPSPDVFHLNDWQTALIAIYLKTTYRRPELARTRSVFTIHNLGYQGMFPAPQLYATGLDWGTFHAGGLEFFGLLNLVKGGIVHADALTTVSPTYAEEIQTPALGHGLDGVLSGARDRLTGILNGIDTRRWDPATDPYLPVHFSAGNLSGKPACKRALQERVGLPPHPDALLLGAISRFDVQKGIGLIANALAAVAALPVQLVAIGSGDPALEQRMLALTAAFPRQAAVTIGFDESLAHLIEAGADAFLMPSAYEPCGLSQMYSQRYGTVPIVHATGGLKDTVVDYTPARLAGGSASGFAFTVYDAAHLVDAILRAWELFSSTPDTWRHLQLHCMTLDRSWSRSARAYAGLYSRLAGA